MTKKKRRPRPRVRRTAPPAPFTGGLPPASAMPYTTMIMAQALPPCPWCGGTVGADADSGAVVHGVPPYARFVAMDPLAFLVAMRHEIERRAASEVN